jgi:streptogramin lyase
MAVAGNVAWVTTKGGKWAGLTRLTPDGATFWPLRGGREDFGQLVARRDGGAWLILDEHTVGRVMPNGEITSYRVGADVGYILTAAPRDDLYFMSGESRLVRMDGRGRTTVRELDLPEARENPGVECDYSSMTADADGIVWLSSITCSRVLRVPLEGAVQEIAFTGDKNAKRAIRVPGNMTWSGEDLVFSWAGGIRDPIARSTGSGQITPIQLDAPVAALARQLKASPYVVTRGDDGQVWFAVNGACMVGRVEGARFLSFPAPFGAWMAQSDRAGAVWVAGTTAVTRIAEPGADVDQAGCDLDEPTFYVDHFAGSSVKLSDLERDGLVYELTEPAVLSISVFFHAEGQDDFGAVETERVVRERGTIHIPVPPDVLAEAREHLDTGGRLVIEDSTTATDASGNTYYTFQAEDDGESTRDLVE